MKKIVFQIVKYFIFGIVYFSGISTLYRRMTKGRLRILCYHRISSRPCDPLLDVSADRFRAQMYHIKRRYIPLPLSLGLDIVQRPTRNGVMPPVAVTFDDGTTDWLTHTLPVLEETQIPATFFVCTGYIDKGNIPYPNQHTPATALSRKELSALSASPFVQIGGHTLHHPHLSQLNAHDALREIAGSRTLLSLWLQQEISVFAYPFGDDPDYTDETMALTREAGYRAGLTLDERTCGYHDDLFSLPRLVIFDEPLWMFAVRVSGILDDFLNIYKKRKHTTKKNVVTSTKLSSVIAIAVPTVSVVIRTKDKSAMLRKALESVQTQTYRDWEALILDDGSTDDTPSIVKAFCCSDKRFRYIRNNPPLGKTRNCNYGLYQARGEFIAMLDGDDYWSDPEKLERQVARMREGTDISVCAGGVVKVDVTDGGRTHTIPNVWHNDQEIRNAIMIENMIPHSTLMFRKDEALRVGGYEERFVLSEDFDLILKLGLKGKFHMDRRTYCHYHLHGKNATDTQKLLQLMNTLRILMRHARYYPNACRGILHISLRMISTLLPIGVKNKAASFLQYRDRRYRYMAHLAEK